MRGIYCITNIINGKIYIGQSSSLKKRLTEHLNHLRSGKHENTYLQRAFSKYGEENFKFDILLNDNNLSDEELDVIEYFYIKIFNAHRHSPGGHGYNLALGGKTRRGFKHEPETLRKMSEDRKGKNNAFYGKAHSEETKKKISSKLKGYSISEEHRQKLSEAMKGRIFTEEHRHNKSNAQRGGKNPIAKKVSIEGTVYDCIQDAATHYGLRHNTVSYRINSTSETFKDWFYLNNLKA